MDTTTTSLKPATAENLDNSNLIRNAFSKKNSDKQAVNIATDSIKIILVAIVFIITSLVIDKKTNTN